MSYAIVYSDNELYHHGIKGQKWGVRRYQNTDGTRTSLGKSRAFNKTARKIEKGKKLEERGVTRTKAVASAAIGIGAAYLGKKLLTKGLLKSVLNSDLDATNDESMIKLGKSAIAYLLATSAISGMAIGNVIKQGSNISNINAYEAAKDYKENNK